MGCKECRSKYNLALKEYLKGSLDKMCKTCQERYEKNPLRILDCKEEGCKELTKTAPKITDYLCDDCKTHFEKLKEYLDASNLSYTVNPYIVRGLDYYSKTVFEFVTNALGSQGTVCGGGRYDGLIEQIGGNSVPGVGFGMGLERILMLMEASGVEIPKEDGVKVFIASSGDKAQKKAFELCYKLRQKGVDCETDHLNRSFKSQFKYADKIGAEYVLAIGDNELETNAVNVKKMIDGTTISISLNDVINYEF
jgi:histidyl-tRNA synthetase